MSNIHFRTEELSFGTAFLREMHTILQAKGQAGRHVFLLNRLELRLRRLNIYLMEPDQQLANLDRTSKLDNHRGFLLWLRDLIRAQADLGLNQNLACLGRRSSIEAAAAFC